MDFNKLSWRKATASGGDGGDCVQTSVIELGDPNWEEFVKQHAAHKPGQTKYHLVRDSKLDPSPVLVFDPAEWRAFLNGVKNGEFDYVALTSA